MMKSKLLLSILTIILVWSCTSNKPLTYNYSFLYDQQLQPYEPCLEKTVNPDSSILFNLWISPNKLFFKKQAQTDSVKANLQLVYKTFASYNKPKVIQKDTLHYSWTRNLDDSTSLELEFKIPHESKQQFVFFKISQSNSNELQVLLEPLFKEPLSQSRKSNCTYYPWIETTRVSFNNADTTSNVLVQAYHNLNKLSPPPFEDYYQLDLDVKPDSSFEINPNHFEYVNLLNQGHYLFYQNNTQLESKTIFSESYPFISDPNQLLPPLRLITTNQEFKNFRYINDLKLAIDNFWIDKCESKERAKKVIEEFYGRVERANLYFTDFREGWKTDRGIIYVIYGAPDHVLKTDFQEKWIYEGSSSAYNIDFVFNKVYSPLSNTIFELVRESSYKNSWYQQIDAWRKGRIYAGDEE